MEKDNVYDGMEWFAGGGGGPAKYEKSEIEIPVVEKKEERTMVNQTCENCMHKGVCKHQEIFENICKNENLFSGVEVCLGENRYGRLTNLDFIEIHRPTCKHFLPKTPQEFGNFGQFCENLWPVLNFVVRTIGEDVYLEEVDAL